MQNQKEFQRFHFFLKRTCYRYCCQFYMETFLRFKERKRINYKLVDGHNKAFIDNVVKQYCLDTFGPDLFLYTNSVALQKFLNQMIVFIFSNRLPGTKEDRLHAPIRDEFIRETLAQLKQYEQPDIDSFETIWTVKYRFSQNSEHELFKNHMNNLLIYLFCSHPQAPGFVREQCEKLKSDVRCSIGSE